MKRRALSGKPESKQAVKDLCSIAKDRSLFSDILPTLLRLLSQYEPPGPHPAEVGESRDLTEIVIILDIFTTIALIASTENKISLRRSWKVIYTWSTCLVHIYVEPQLNSRDSLDWAGIEVLKAVLLLLATLLETKTIFAEEIGGSREMAGWFIRVHLYALFVDCSGSSVDSSVVELSNSSAKILASVLVNDSNDLWGDIYFQGVKTLAPRLAPIVTRMLPHLIQQRPLNYAVLRYRFCMMTSMASMSDTCNAIFLRHRAVYFTTCFLRHLCKILHPRRAGMIISEETKNDVIQCWVWCIKYLCSAFNYGGYESIILSLNSGLLQALWGLVEGHMNIREFNPGHQFPGSELIRDVLNLLSASSLYRSVHKPLERILDKLPLDRTHSSDESGQIWRDFKLLVKNRAELRRRWEEKKITLCSNLGVSFSPEC